MLKDEQALHTYYLDILSCMPNIVYWLDKECRLVGCNQNAYDWLGITRCSDFTDAPYKQLLTRTGWNAARVKALQLDDMAAIFSAKVTKDKEESPVIDAEGNTKYYLSSRVPLWDSNKQVIGLVVCLTEIKAPIKPTLPATIQYAAPNYTPTILLVEDNPIARSVESALFTNLDCEVDVAATGSEALALFEPGKYDLIFMEIILVDISGYMVAKKIRQAEASTNFHVPIIALTNFDAAAIAADCKYYSMDQVLEKPLGPHEAQVIIARYCSSKAFTMDSVMALASPNSM
jgi:CheY-like chemotaxis protein